MSASLLLLLARASLHRYVYCLSSGKGVRGASVGYLYNSKLPILGPFGGREPATKE